MDSAPRSWISGPPRSFEVVAHSIVTPAVALFLQYFEELSRRELLGWRLYGILSKEFLKHTQVDTQTARLSVRVDQILATIVRAPQDDVGVGVVGVPVVDRDPLELGSEVSLYGGHKLAGKVPQVGECDPVFGGDNEAKLVTILSSRCREFLPVGHVHTRAVGLRRPAVVADPFSRDIAKVCIDCLSCHVFEIDDPRLDHHPSRIRAKLGPCNARRDGTTSESRQAPSRLRRRVSCGHRTDAFAK